VGLKKKGRYRPIRVGIALFILTQLTSPGDGA